MSTEDIIHYTQKGVELIFDVKVNEILQDVNYTPILIALREKPMTVRDLEERYNEIALNEIEKAEISNDEKEKLKKKVIRKNKTLYRYLKYLIDNNLVVVAGRRVTKNQTASETLYGRKAEIFYFVERPSEFW